jgi:hypothetical protein
MFSSLSKLNLVLQSVERAAFAKLAIESHYELLLKTAQVMLVRKRTSIHESHFLYSLPTKGVNNYFKNFPIVARLSKK